MPARPNALILDYGEVLCHPQPQSELDAMAHLCGMRTAEFKRIYWELRVDYDRGRVDEFQYWTELARAGGHALSHDQIAQLAGLDNRSWSHFNPAMIRWAERIRRDGVRIAMLSNMPRQFRRHLTQVASWLAIFDAVVCSCDVGAAKPEPAIFERCLERLNMSPADVLFVDDRPANVESAHKLGIAAVRFESEQQLGRELRAYGLPDPLSGGA